MGAERYLARELDDSNAYNRFEPLSVRIDKGYGSERHVTDQGGEPGDIIVVVIRRRI